MGLLMDGEWITKNAIAETNEGKFEREASTFLEFVGSEKFPFEAGRYHLYISHACPWCHRTMIFRALKKLEDVVSVGVVEPHMGDNGWTFGEAGDPLTGVTHAYELYQKADPDFTGKVTVPILWDKQQETIVNNESSEIIRMFNSVFSAEGPELCPDVLLDEIEALNEAIYHDINNGVYKSGFATSQAAYEEAVEPLFARLDEMEARLEDKRYLFGAAPCETDWRLFVTLIRFDEVYANHFNCNRRRIADYPNLFGYMKDLYQIEGVKGTVHMDHIKEHYYTSHPHLNPQGVIPVGPGLDLDTPHGRERLSPDQGSAVEADLAGV